MAEGSPTTPTLPFELERRIFELSALSRPVSIPALLRIACRVKHWIEPLLYRTLVIGAHRTVDDLRPCTVDTFMRVVRTNPAAFLRDSVRNLMVYRASPAQTKLILAACPRVENLYILFSDGTADGPPASIEALPLRHLYCNFTDLCTTVAFASLSHSIFSNITHLEFFDGLREGEYAPAQWAGVTGLLHLTHLAFDTPKLLIICPYLLSACRALRALVLLCSARVPAILAEDPRFVTMEVLHYTEDWQRGVLMGDDYWSHADALIAKRIAAEIDRG
ncbi:hypothetical protein FB451DRAFT_1376767 [Mycena latifolia]|nr:hypothetical protein FB451DRAFT_1376767 [Mycena latifolia]